MVCGDLGKVHQTTVERIIKKVSLAISGLLNRYVKFPPTEDALEANRQRFYNIAGFPGVSGCIDCTHIPIQNPGGQNGEIFRNRKTSYSINVQVCIYDSLWLCNT